MFQLVNTRPKTLNRKKLQSFLLIQTEQVSITGGQNIVEVLKKAFFFDVEVSENKCCPFALNSTRAIQQLQVLQKVGYVVRPVIAINCVKDWIIICNIHTVDSLFNRPRFNHRSSWR